MTLRLPIAAVSGALLAAGSLVLLSAAPALAVATVSGSGTGTVYTQLATLAHGGGQAADVVVVGSDVYVANHDNDTVDVFNESTGAYITSVGVSGDPIALAATADGSKVYVADQGSDVEAINTASNTLNGASTFGLADSPVSIAVSPGGTTIYVLFNGSQQVSSFNLAGTLQHTSTTSGVTTGFHVVVSPDGSKVYVTYRDSAPSGGDGGLVILDANLNNITTIDIPSASGIGFAPSGTSLFVGGTTTAFVGHVAELSEATNAPISGHDAVVDQEPEHLVASPNGDWVYSMSRGSGTISFVDRSDFSSTSSGALADPTGTAVSPDGLHLYVSEGTSGYTDVFSIAQVTVSAASTIVPGTASTPFTVSVADGNPTLGDYSFDNVEVDLYDASNTLVGSSSALMDISGTMTLPIDTSTLPLGVYHATATLSDAQAGTQTSATATGFTVKATLATTGVDATGPIILGAILLGAGLLLFALRAVVRRRRPTI